MAVAPEILDFTITCMCKAPRILVKTDELTLERLQQLSVAIEEEELNFDTLRDLCGTLAVTQVITCCRTRRREPRSKKR